MKTSPSSSSVAPTLVGARAPFVRGLSVLVAVLAFSGAMFAQEVAETAGETKFEAKGGSKVGAKSEKKAEKRETKLVAQADPAADPNARRRQRGQDGADGGNGGRGNFDPAQMQERMMTALRTQFDVTDDAEWKLIQDRITAVTEVRRAAGGGLGGFMIGGRGPGGPGGPGGQGGPGGGRGGRGGNPEADALRQAIQDKLPDAEIKSRLTRLRDSRKTNEEKLQKVQEELRAVLTVRQEAVAVMAGLLP